MNPALGKSKLLRFKGSQPDREVCQAVNCKEILPFSFFTAYFFTPTIPFEAN